MNIIEIRDCFTNKLAECGIRDIVVGSSLEPCQSRIIKFIFKNDNVLFTICGINLSTGEVRIHKKALDIISMLAFGTVFTTGVTDLDHRTNDISYESLNLSDPDSYDRVFDACKHIHDSFAEAKEERRQKFRSVVFFWSCVAISILTIGVLSVMLQ